jgi:hypothetical protein
MSGPKLSVIEKTPAEWAALANAVLDSEMRESFFAMLVEEAFKKGFLAGMAHDKDKPLPWEGKPCT